MRIIAPSGPFDRALFYRGLGWLSQRYEVLWDRGVFQRERFLAGNDARRLAELDAALRDGHTAAIIAARGGYGATRIVDRADFSMLRKHPKWCVGFSDFTALHVEAARQGVGSLHAANLMALGRADSDLREEWIAALERPRERRCFGPLERITAGHAAGPLFGGNLSLLFCAAAAGRLELPQGCILFLEELNEAPYRIDRMLTGLLSGRHLERAAAICVGDLWNEDGAPPREQALEVVHERLGQLGIPMACGLPIGHGRINRSLHCGSLALLHGREQVQLIVNPDPAELGV